MPPTRSAAALLFAAGECDNPESMSTAPARVLANFHLPPMAGIIAHTFGDYTPAGPDPLWRQDAERRNLSEILPLIPAFERPDALVIASPEYLPIPPDVAAFPGAKILLITDWNVCLRFLPDMLGLFDYCFTDWPGYRLLQKAGIRNIHHQAMFGHDASVFRPLDRQRNLDVSFCGNLNSGLHLERNRLLARVARWAGPRPVHLRQAFEAEYVEVLNRSRLVFNYSIRGEANMRLFEAMACGAVPLVEATNQEAAILFQEGRHFFRYEAGRLETRLDELLADPARIAAVGAAAKAAVAGHTKASQMRALLETVGRESAARPGGAPSPPQTEPAKALAKLRVLGANYTLAEAIDELQNRSAGMPGLDAETLPACVLTFLEGSSEGGTAGAEAFLERFISDGRQPAWMGAFLRMRLELCRRSWQATLDLARLCLESLAGMAAPATESPADRLERLRGVYGRFFPPIGLGKGFNTDINQAYRHDLTTPAPGWEGFIGLLQAHCRVAQARALLALGRPAEAYAAAAAIPAERFVSLDALSLRADALRRMVDTPRLREVLAEALRAKPLDTGVWDQAAEALMGSGDKPALLALLEDLSVLARHFLPEAQAEKVRERLAQERG